MCLFCPWALALGTDNSSDGVYTEPPPRRRGVASKRILGATAYEAHNEGWGRDRRAVTQEASAPRLGGLALSKATALDRQLDGAERVPECGSRRRADAVAATSRNIKRYRSAAPAT